MFDHKNIKKLYDNHFVKYKHEIDRVLALSDHDRVISFSHRESINRLKERYDTISIKI